MKYIWQDKKWPHFYWSDEVLINVLAQARRMQGEFLTKVKFLTASVSREAQSEILVEESVKTSEIEGEILSRDSVRSSVARHLDLSVNNNKYDRNADGLVEVLLDATENYNKHLDKKRLFSWHAALFPTGYSGLHKISIAQFRGPQPMQIVSGPIGKERIHYEAPPYDRVANEMKVFFDWWEASKNSDGILSAGIAHFYFVIIHPFEDGNGRIARTLTDMALAQDEKLSMRFYSLSSQIMAERNNYYNILDKCSHGNCDITEWLKWFLECFIRALQNSEKILQRILDKSAFWQKFYEVSLTDRQRKVINKLLDLGRGNFEGGMTTGKYISIAKVSRATAFREISDLVNKKILIQNNGQGRSVSYDINWG